MTCWLQELSDVLGDDVVLERGGYDVAPRVAAAARHAGGIGSAGRGLQRAQASNGVVGAFAAAAGKNYFVRVTSNKVSDLIAGRFECSLCLLSGKHD